MLLIVMAFLSCKSPDSSKHFSSIEIKEYNIPNATLQTDYNSGRLSIILNIYAPLKPTIQLSDSIPPMLLNVLSNSIVDKENRVQNFYKNLITDGYDEKTIGSLNQFSQAIKDSQNAADFYFKLIKEGYTVDNLGSISEFIEALSYTSYDKFCHHINKKSATIKFFDSQGFLLQAVEFPLIDLLILRAEDNSIQRATLNSAKEVDIKKYHSIESWSLVLH